MMKELTKHAPAIGIIAGGTALAISFYAGQATAQHNDKPEAHPVITQQIRDNAKDIDAQKQIWVVMQANNDSAHINFAKAQDRMILVLDRMEAKLDRTLANR